MYMDKDELMKEVEAIMSSEEAMAETARKIHVAIKHIGELGEAMDKILDDLGPVAMALGDIGLVVSLNVAEQTAFSLIKGPGSSVKLALAHLVKEIVKGD